MSFLCIQEGHSISHGKLPAPSKHVVMQETKYTLLKAYGMYLHMIPLDGANDRRQATNTSFESWFRCFIVPITVNME
jgi:hypothetical protein